MPNVVKAQCQVHLDSLIVLVERRCFYGMGLFPLLSPNKSASSNKQRMKRHTAEWLNEYKLLLTGLRPSTLHYDVNHAREAGMKITALWHIYKPN